MNWFKRKKQTNVNNTNTNATNHDVDTKQAEQLNRAAKRLIDRLHIPLAVPDAAVDLFKEAAKQPDAVTALVPAKDIADDAGGCDKYLAIAVSGKTLVENGFEVDRSHHSTYVDREAAGQLAAALESSQIESVTFAEDRNGGYIVMLPDAKTLNALSTIDAIGGHNGDVNMFMWVLFPANIDEATDESDLQSEGTRVMVSFNTLYAASKQHIKPHLLRDSKGIYRVILSGVNDSEVDEQAREDNRAANSEVAVESEATSDAENSATSDEDADVADLIANAHNKDAQAQLNEALNNANSSQPTPDSISKSAAATISAAQSFSSDTVPATTQADSAVNAEIMAESEATVTSNADSSVLTPNNDSANSADSTNNDVVMVSGIGEVPKAKFQEYLRKYAADDPSLHPDFFNKTTANDTANTANSDNTATDDNAIETVGTGNDADYLAKVHDAIYNNVATNDLDLKIDKHALDELLLLNQPYQFSFAKPDKSLRDDGLTALANETRRKYNDTLRNQHDNNNNKLVDDFNADMRDIVSQIKHQMALDNVGDSHNKTWGALYQDLNNEYQHKVDELQPLIAKQQDLLQQEYDRNREDFAKQAADSARLQYDKENKHNLNMRKDSVGNEVARSLQMNFINAKNKLLSERASQAQRVLDAKQSEVVDALRHRKHVYTQEEHDQYVQANESLQALMENNFQADANKQQALADIAKHDETIHDLRDRNAALVKENTSRVNALNNEIASLKRDHATQISNIKQQYDNERAAALAEQQQRDADEYDKLKKIKDDLNNKLNDADKNAEAAVAKQKKDDNQIIDHYQQTISALTAQNNALSSQNQQLNTNANNDAKHNTKTTVITGVLAGLAGLVFGGGLMFGIGSATHADSHTTEVTQPQPKQTTPNITVNVPTNHDSNASSSSSSSASSSSTSSSSSSNLSSSSSVNNNH